MFLETWQNLPQNTCARVSLLIKLQACNFIERETLAQVFCCEFCEIFKNTFLTEHLRWVFLKLAKHRSLNAVLILQRCIQNFCVIFSLLWRHYQTPNQNIKWKIYLINKCMKYFVRSISMWMSYAGLIARRNKVFQQETFFERKQIHIFLWNCSHFHTSKMELFEKTVHDLSKMELFEKTVHDFKALTIFGKTHLSKDSTSWREGKGGSHLPFF